MTTPTIERVRVRYGEVDRMGHAYYANYFYWFEAGRGAWCRARGFNYADLEEMGFKLPVVEAHAEYKAEVLYDDEIEVSTRLTEVRRASLRFEYEVRRGGTLCTTGWTWHVTMGSARKAVSVPAEVREWLMREPT